MQRTATAFATSTRNSNGRKPGSGAEFAGMLLGAFVSALCDTVNMVKLDGTLDPVSMMEVASKVASFVKSNTDKPESIKVDTSLHGEISIYVKGRRVFEAKKDFVNDQLWTIEVDQRVHDALTKPNLF